MAWQATFAWNEAGAASNRANADLHDLPSEIGILNVEAIRHAAEILALDVPAHPFLDEVPPSFRDERPIHGQDEHESSEHMPDRR